MLQHDGALRSPTRGLFIVLEGLDRSGKSTQVARLVAQLQRSGRKAQLQKFPDRTTAIGKMIDSYLQSQSELDDRAIHLLFSANRWECARGIEKLLAEGITVIADRYAFSGIAFSAAKGLDFDFCLNPDTGLFLPDITLYLSLPLQVAAQRGAFGDERYETVDIQRRVREQFDLVAERVRRIHGPEKWHEISADGTIDEVETRIWSALQNVLSGSPPELGKLWI